MNSEKLFECVCRIAHSRCPEIFPDYNKTLGQTFSSLCSSSAFPGFWLEIPLKQSKIDLHVQFSKKEIKAIKNFHGYRPLFEWFSEFGNDRNGLALAFDIDDDKEKMTCIGSALNVNSGLRMNDAEKFFELSNFPEAINLYHETINLIPQDWHTWYIAAIMSRERKLCRVDSYISNHDVKSYADEPDLFSRQLKTLGYSFDTDELEKFVSWFSKLNTECNLEIQLDRNNDGTMSQSLGLSINFAMIKPSDFRNFFAGEKGKAIISKLSEIFISDKNIKYIGQSSFSSLLQDYSGFLGVLCIPAFLKTVWLNGVPVKSKLYCEFNVKYL